MMKIQRAKTFRLWPIVEVEDGAWWCNWLWWRAHGYATVKGKSND